MIHQRKLEAGMGLVYTLILIALLDVPDCACVVVVKCIA